MKDDKMIRMKSSLGAEFNSEVTIGDEKYIIQTEEGGVKAPVIKTRVYLKGRIIVTKETDYSDIKDLPSREKKVHELMQKQHQLTISILKSEKRREEKTALVYVEEVEYLLARNREKEAFALLIEGLGHHSENPFLLSYYGYLDAAINRNYKEGIETCIRALESLKRQVPFGEEFFYPVMYLNLGKAYLAEGKKKEAVKVFTRGYEIDRENTELLKMLRSLGIRKRPAIPCLKRAHFLNRLLGMIRHLFRK